MAPFTTRNYNTTSWTKNVVHTNYQKTCRSPITPRTCCSQHLVQPSRVTLLQTMITIEKYFSRRSILHTCISIVYTDKVFQIIGLIIFRFRFNNSFCNKINLFLNFPAARDISSETIYFQRNL